MLRCPYCKGAFAAIRNNRCPLCKKTLLAAAFFGSGKTAEAIRTAKERSRARRPAAPLAGMLAHPARIVIVIAVLMGAGYLLLQRVSRPPPPDEAYRRNLSQLNLEALGAALELVRADCSRYPTTKEGLVSLVHDPGLAGWRGPYIFELKPDPWGRPFAYTSDGDRFEISSAGADGRPGSADDRRATSGPSPKDGSDADTAVYRANLLPAMGAAPGK